MTNLGNSKSILIHQEYEYLHFTHLIRAWAVVYFVFEVFLGPVIRNMLLAPRFLFG